MGIDFLLRFAHSGWDVLGPSSVVFFSAAALGVGLVGVLTFRAADGFVFSATTMAACALVCALGTRSERWN